MRLEQLVVAIEQEMRAVGYWSASGRPSSQPDPSLPYAGLSFEEWLQFVHLPEVVSFASTGQRGPSLSYRVGLAALRHYDYHSYVPAAQRLLELCQRLESAL